MSLLLFAVRIPAEFLGTGTEGEEDRDTEIADCFPKRSVRAVIPGIVADQVTKRRNELDRVQAVLLYSTNRLCNHSIHLRQKAPLIHRSRGAES